MNAPMTYEDFISQVEKAMPPDSPLRLKFLWNWNEQIWDEQMENVNANSNFEFKDMEVGKIYVFWNRGEMDEGQLSWETWFLSPTTLVDKFDYNAYWCYYRIHNIPKPSGGEGGIAYPSTPSYQSRGELELAGWDGNVWSGQWWKVLNDKPPFKDAFINWDKLPWGDKQ